MVTLAGVNYPCADCSDRHRCRSSRKNNIARKVFFAIASRCEVVCPEYQEERYHGVEGCRA